MNTYKLYAFADEADKYMDGQIAAMLRNGLQGLEVRNVDGTNVSSITLEKAKEVRQKLDDNGLITWSIGSPIGKMKIDGDWEAHLNKYRHTLEVADILGAKNIRMFSFFMPKGEDPVTYRQLVIDRLGQFLEIAKGTGIALCHENEKGIYGDIASRCVEIHRALPALRAVFDPANFANCREDVLTAWELLAPYNEYLHIKDVAEDETIVPAGEGICQMQELIRRYRANGGTVMTLEPHLSVFDGFAALEKPDEKTNIASYRYASGREAFDAAVGALKKMI